MSMNDYAMDMAEDIINDMYNRVSEGEITFDDTQRIYADDLRSEQIESLKFIVFSQWPDFIKVIEITGDINE